MQLPQFCRHHRHHCHISHKFSSSQLLPRSPSRICFPCKLSLSNIRNPNINTEIFQWSINNSSGGGQSSQLHKIVYYRLNLVFIISVRIEDTSGLVLSPHQYHWNIDNLSPNGDDDLRHKFWTSKDINKGWIAQSSRWKLRNTSGKVWKGEIQIS